MAKPLAGKIALVTGATKGIGRGIAIQLGQNGAKVYFTGRTLKSSGSGGSLEDTLEEIKKRGGQNAVPIQCDHEKASEVEELFKRIQKDEKGLLDILVNNVYKGVETIFSSIRQKFWESPDPARIWDDINNAGLRNHFICTALASRIMVPRRQGLIVNVSSLGGQGYLFNVAYGVGKAGVDRMAVDCGIELKKHNVACLSLMLGAVRTEKMTNLVGGASGDKLKLKGDPNTKQTQDTSLKKILEDGESVEFGGKIITHMAGENASNIMKYSSKIVIASDYAHKYNITDIDGRVVPSHREFRNAVMVLPKQYRWMANYVPGSFKVPQFLINIVNNKVC